MLHVFKGEILANMTQVSDVAHGPLVSWKFICKFNIWFQKNVFTCDQLSSCSIVPIWLGFSLYIIVGLYMYMYQHLINSLSLCIWLKKNELAAEIWYLGFFIFSNTISKVNQANSSIMPSFEACIVFYYWSRAWDQAYIKQRHVN
jgi:hypothetical protein